MGDKAVNLLYGGGAVGIDEKYILTRRFRHPFSDGGSLSGVFCELQDSVLVGQLPLKQVMYHRDCPIGAAVVNNYNLAGEILVPDKLRYPGKEQVNSLLLIVNRYDNTYKGRCAVHWRFIKKVFYLRVINSYTGSALGVRLLIDET
jgi:hypothetical protein